jgi:hypothetical protein
MLSTFPIARIALGSIPLAAASWETVIPRLLAIAHRESPAVTVYWLDPLDQPAAASPTTVAVAASTATLRL